GVAGRRGPAALWMRPARHSPSPVDRERHAGHELSLWGRAFLRPPAAPRQAKVVAAGGKTPARSPSVTGWRPRASERPARLGPGADFDVRNALVARFRRAGSLAMGGSYIGQTESALG